MTTLFIPIVSSRRAVAYVALCHSIGSLRSLTTILSVVPASTFFGTVGGGTDRISVKYPSEDSDGAFCSVADLADLADAVMDLVIAEVTKKTCVFLLILHDILHDPCHYLANVPTQSQT